jgi:hypothetical protein
MHLVVYLVGNKSMALNKSRHLPMRESNPSRLALMKNLSPFVTQWPLSASSTKFTPLELSWVYLAFFTYKHCTEKDVVMSYKKIIPQA